MVNKGPIIKRTKRHVYVKYSEFLKIWTID